MTDDTKASRLKTTQKRVTAAVTSCHENGTSLSLLIEQYSQAACQKLGIDQDLWVEHHSAYSNAPAKAQLNYYVYIAQYGFNPLFQEIILAKHPNQSWQVFITVDGWSAYMNQHPQFSGISFEESEERIDDVAKWIQCTIYRHDRAVPITVREYYAEVKSDHLSWEQKPRRMLRHRAMNQCARLAFGISLPEAIEDTACPRHGNKDSLSGKTNLNSKGVLKNGYAGKLYTPRTEELRQVLRIDQ